MLISKVSNLCVSNYNGRRNISFIRIRELITHNEKCSAFINSERCVYITLFTLLNDFIQFYDDFLIAQLHDKNWLKQW